MRRISAELGQRFWLWFWSAKEEEEEEGSDCLLPRKFEPEKPESEMGDWLLSKAEQSESDTDSDTDQGVEGPLPAVLRSVNRLESSENRGVEDSL